MLPNVKTNSRFIQEAVTRCRRLKDAPFTIVDVGASGGVSPVWGQFGADARIIGFEPNGDEAGKDVFPDNVQIYPIGLGRRAGTQELRICKFPYASHTLPIDETFWKRFPNYDYFELDRLETIEVIDFDGFAATNGIGPVDFFKLDTEGTELEILRGAENALTQSVLGVQIEVGFDQYHVGRAVFADVDIFMREHGFSLFELCPLRLARSALPHLHAVDVAPASYGQMLWGDALYLRDLMVEANRDFAQSPAMVLKTICLYDIFGYPDCAVELLEWAIAQGVLPPELWQASPHLVPNIFQRRTTVEYHRSLYKTLGQWVMGGYARTKGGQLED